MVKVRKIMATSFKRSCAKDFKRTIKKAAAATAAAAKSLQSCPTLCDPLDSSPPGSPVPGILQARYWSGFPCPHECVMSNCLLGGLRYINTSQM